MHIHNIFIFTIEGFIIGVLATLCIGMIFYDHDYVEKRTSKPQQITIVEKKDTPSTNESKDKPTKSQRVYVHKKPAKSSSNKPEKIYVYKSSSKGTTSKYHIKNRSDDAGGKPDPDRGGDADGATFRGATPTGHM